MLKLVPARFFRALFCAAVATMALPVASHANNEQSSDGPATMGDVDVPPPNTGDEEPASTDDGAPPSARPAASAEPSRPATAARPVQSDAASKQAARDAAKRALFGDPKKDSEKPNPYLDVRGADYYDRRAKDLLQSDVDKGKVELHPLMEAHPDSYVVVCTAGCASDRGASIVSMLPKPAAAKQPPVSTPDPQNGGNVVSCVAGCGADGYTTIASTPTGGSVVAATVGEWMTTVAKVPPNAEAPAPKPTGSGDWMDKINQDRAQQKAALPPVPAKSDTPSQAQISEPKPAAPAVAAAPKAVAPVETKPKPAAVAEAKPAMVPAAPVAEAKPAPAMVVEAKPAPAATSPVATPPAAKPVVVTAEAKSAPSSAAAAVEAKASAPEQKSVSPSATQMAALEAPKAPVAAPVAKAAEATPAAGNGSLFSNSAKVSSPAPAAAADPKPMTPPAAAEAKPADANTSLFKDSTKVAATAPDAKPATSPAAIADPKPAPGATSLFKDQTKVAAVAPPTANTPDAAVPPKQKDGVISVLSEDKDMNAAIQTARGTLASFWKSYDAPATGETDHALKVAVAGNGTTEHFWLTRIKRDGGKFSGVISNQPQSVKTVKVGQRYDFTDDMISDWTFKRNGKLVGNETMRVLLPRMPEEQAAVYRKMYETP